MSETDCGREKESLRASSLAPARKPPNETSPCELTYARLAPRIACLLHPLPSGGEEKIIKKDGRIRDILLQFLRLSLHVWPHIRSAAGLTLYKLH